MRRHIGMNSFIIIVIFIVIIMLTRSYASYELRIQSLLTHLHIHMNI